MRALIKTKRKRLATKHADQLLNDLFLFRSILRVHRAVNAVTQMLAQQIALNARQRRARSLDLRDYINAIPVLFDHLRNATNLAFNTVEVFQNLY